PGDLVAGAEHGNTLGQEECRQEVSHLALPEFDGLRVIRRPLDPAVPREVVVRPVLIVLAIGLVVLDVVADEVGEGEAVVGRDEVDAGVGPTAALLVEIARAREPVAELRHLPLVALPVAAYGVAVLSVPFGPPYREIADLIAALAEIPGLGDQLDLGD